MSESDLQGRIPPDPCQEPPPSGLAAGIEEFNRGEYFECHETLEELWMAETRPIRRFYQGILQIGVAFHHLRAGRYKPVIWLLERGSSYLHPFGRECMGVDVTGLLAATAHCRDELLQLGPDGVRDFDWSLTPRIERLE
jgi:predicted metal-dependent hydrolase